MARRSGRHHLATWEIALVKAMLRDWKKSDQDILAYFTRPVRSINHRLVSQIRTGNMHARIKPASSEQLSEFVKNYPRIDWDTGLHLYGDELLIKSREAMLNAVQTYNNPRAQFRSEIFIVLAVIAWTYLMHAFYKNEGVDYRYKRGGGGRTQIDKTAQGAERYWNLEKCLQAQKCPLDEMTKSNLFFLLEIRHEIEHRMTNRIDDFISAKLQACCQNFNAYIKKIFGEELGFDNDLSFAIQFSHLSLEQQREMVKAQDIPENIILAQDQFEDRLDEDALKDPRYAVRVLFTPKNVNRKGQADQVVEFVSANSEDGKKINRVLIKESERKNTNPGKLCEKCRKKGLSSSTCTITHNCGNLLRRKHRKRGMESSLAMANGTGIKNGWKECVSIAVKMRIATSNVCGVINRPETFRP